MKTKTMAFNILGISLILIMLACTISSEIQPVNAQSIVVPNGNVSMWTSQGYYQYGEELYLYISTNYAIYRARLQIRNWGGPSYRMDLGTLWPGQQYQIPVGQSEPPAGRVIFILSDGWQQIAFASCYTGP